MAYSGQAFPALQYGNRFNQTKVGVSWPVAVAANSGFEYRTLRFGYPRMSWTIPARNLTWADKQTLLAFWNQMGGQLQSFRFTDPENNALTAYNFGAGTQISAPAAPTLAATTGTLAATTYTYRVTAYNAQGETVASTSTPITLASTGGVTVTWTAVAGAVGYRVYGRTGTLGKIADVTGLTFTDSGSVTPGAAAPSVNGTGTLQYPCVITVAGVNHPLFHVDGLTITPSNYTLQVINGQPTLVYAAGAAPVLGTSVLASGSYALCARFDSSAGYAIANAVNPSQSAVAMDAIKLIEVFE
ncbi:MAG: DUF2460 domain-containing protein [Candidatus Micrarchaeota archaeon]|nr:DUF2460 domain-containing protein [Candidatus Micrarchaeota archaeon]